MIPLLPAERGTISQYIYSLCGVWLDESKDYLIEGRLGGLAERAGCGSFTQFVAHAKRDSSKVLERRIIDAITTNETLFFRDNSPFELLRYKIVPELIDRQTRTGGAKIRIWSAACSTGQELYSIAMVLKDLLGNVDRYGISFLGTDISDDAVARASKGSYNALEVSRGLPAELRSKYFVRHGECWQVHDELRALVAFRRLNLLSDFSSLGKFDLIFCRNVAIYFNDRDRRSLFERLGRALQPGGFLVVGSMETLNGICPELESKRHLRAVFYQPKSAASAATR